MAKIAARYSDVITVTSDNPRFEDPDAIIDEVCTGFGEHDHYQRITDREKAIRHVIASAGADHIILIAGKGHEDYQEIGGKRHPMDDRALAGKALQQRKSPKPIAGEKLMLYWLLDYIQTQFNPPGFGVFGYITVRSALAAVHGPDHIPDIWPENHPLAAANAGWVKRYVPT